MFEFRSFVDHWIDITRFLILTLCLCLIEWMESKKDEDSWNDENDFCNPSSCLVGKIENWNDEE